ncbi:MAG: phosphotransferase [Propionicimonas sp.]|nr:phosphotransferase [Propionicimonas sp.]
MSTTSRPAVPPTAPTEVAGWVREVAGRHDPRVGPTTPVVPLLTYGLPTRPFAPATTDVFICASVAVKIHPEGTNPEVLSHRLAAIAQPAVERAWVQPLGYRPLPAPAGRVATLWPRIGVLGTLDRPPWQEAGRLLARLHTGPVEDANPPPDGGLVLLQRTIEQLRAGRVDVGHPTEGDLSEHARGPHRPGPAELADTGERLASELARPVRTCWVHGDFHLGHLGHTLLRRQWRLVDVDHVGVGEPAWDLARPAAWYAAGLLDQLSWHDFITGYRTLGGPALPAEGDPWPALETAARASALVAAVSLLGRVHAEATADALLAVAWGRR